MRGSSNLRHNWRRLSLGLESLLWAVVVAAAVYGVFAISEVVFARQAATAISSQAKPAADADENVVPHSAAEAIGANAESQPIRDDGSVIGKLSIPSLNLSVPITTGISAVDLLRGAGHIPGSAVPGGLGNMAVAGHRDTFFRPLRRIRAGMPVYVTGRTGTFRYIVDSTQIVMPDRLSILATGSRPQLTLITCFPFNYIGAAPKRFIVQAHLSSLLTVTP